MTCQIINLDDRRRMRAAKEVASFAFNPLWPAIICGCVALDLMVTFGMVTMVQIASGRS